MAKVYLYGTFDVANTDRRFSEIAGAKFAHPGTEQYSDGKRAVIYTTSDEETARVFGAHCLEHISKVTGVELKI
ncbi:MAG: hypothetical protein WCP89_03620, partial [archaeon]